MPIYKADVSISIRPGVTPVLRLHLDTSEAVQSDIATALQARMFYESELTTFLATVLRDGDCFYDVGANCGYFSILAGHLVGPSGQVVAFEPGADARASFGGLVALNDIADRITLLPHAVAQRVGFVHFQDNGAGDRNGAIYGAISDHPVDSQSVPVTTLDLARKAHSLPVPKLIKLDIEGAEFLALQGATGLLREPAVQFVACEINTPRLVAFGTDPNAIVPFMEAAGFATFLLADMAQRPVYVPPGTRIVSNHVFNILFARPAALAIYWPVLQFVSAVERFNAGRASG